MNSDTRWILSVSFILAAGGFLLPFWPLSLLGILLAAGSGRYIFALAIGLLLDIAYGAPIGHWAFLYVPFTLFAAVIGLLRFYLSGFMRNSQSKTL